jgi:hypothetical protein
MIKKQAITEATSMNYKSHTVELTFSDDFYRQLEAEAQATGTDVGSLIFQYAVQGSVNFQRQLRSNRISTKIEVPTYISLD